MLTLTITATTTDEAIEAAIPFSDMRAHAIELRDSAAAVLDVQGDQEVLELHVFGDDFYVTQDAEGNTHTTIIQRD